MADRGLELENVVYYQMPTQLMYFQGNTHYYVMTPLRDALFRFGVLRERREPPADLQRDNIDFDRLQLFARTVAELFKLPPSCQFVPGSSAVQLFDFSTRKASKTSCDVRSDADGNQVAIMLIGDAVLEPFWPEGLGINRGFHTAFDAEYFSTGHTATAPAMKLAREDLFKIIKSLSAFTKGNIVHENFKAYALDPSTRYKTWRAR